MLCKFPIDLTRGSRNRDYVLKKLARLYKIQQAQLFSLVYTDTLCRCKILLEILFGLVFWLLNVTVTTLYKKCSKRIALVLCFEINKVVRFEVCFNVMLKIVSIEWRKKAENKKCYNVIVINVLICYGITVYCTKSV